MLSLSLSTLLAFVCQEIGYDLMQNTFKLQKDYLSIFAYVMPQRLLLSRIWQQKDKHSRINNITCRNPIKSRYALGNNQAEVRETSL